MRSILPRSRLFGRLELLEVYEYYDAPRLFSCRSITDQIYLAVWIDEDNATESWLYVPISRQRFESVRSGGVDLHATFKESETGAVLKVIIPRMDGISSVVAIETGDLMDDMLPLPGEKLMAGAAALPIATPARRAQARPLRMPRIRSPELHP